VSAVQWRKWRDVEQRLRAKCASIVPWGEAPPPRGGAPSLQQLGDAIAELCEAYVAAELKAAVAVARDLAATVDEYSATLQGHIDLGLPALDSLSAQMSALLGERGEYLIN
jgi:hypothetical protein